MNFLATTNELRIAWSIELDTKQNDLEDQLSALQGYSHADYSHVDAFSRSLLA